MHLYTVSYYSHEDSGKIIISHEKEYSQAEFEEFVIEAAVKVIKEDKDKGIFHHNFSDIYDRTALKLISDYGFNKPEFAAQFEVFGWASMFDENDWQSNRDEVLNRLTKALTLIGFIVEDDSQHQYNEKSKTRRKERREKEDPFLPFDPPMEESE